MQFLRHTCILVEISAEEVEHMLASLSPRKAHGMDGITANMLHILIILSDFIVLHKNGKLVL